MTRWGKKVRLFILCTYLALLTTGCWGHKETDELAYVMALGIDQGEQNIVRVSFQIANPTALAGGGAGGGGEEKGTEIISVEAASLFGALQLANTFISRELTFMHNNVIIISAEIAQAGLDLYINPLLRSRDIRRNATIAVTQGSAYELLKSNQESIEKNPARQFALSLRSMEYSGLTAKISLNEFNKRIKSPGCEPVLALLGVKSTEKKAAEGNPQEYSEKIRVEMSHLPGEITHEGGNNIEFIGLAAFHGEHLVGYLNGTETRYFLMLVNQYQSADFTIPDPEVAERAIIVNITKRRNPEIQVDITGDRPKIRVTLHLEGDILSIQSGVHYENLQKIGELKQYMEEYLREGLMDLVRRTQFDLKSDIFGFGDITRRNFWTWAEWVQYNWVDKYHLADVQIEPIIEIRRTGLMRITAPISKEGEQ